MFTTMRFILCHLKVKNPPANAKDTSSIPGSGKSPGKGNGNPLQYACLENSMDRRAWWAAVHEVAKSWTQLSTHSLTSVSGYQDSVRKADHLECYGINNVF